MDIKINKKDLRNKEVLADMEMINKKQAAHMFGVSTPTIDRWVRAGLLKCNKLGDGSSQQARVYFYLKDINDFKYKNYGFKHENIGLK